MAASIVGGASVTAIRFSAGAKAALAGGAAFFFGCCAVCANVVPASENNISTSSRGRRGNLSVIMLFLQELCHRRSRDHAAIEHLVGNRSGDLVDERSPHLGIAFQHLDRLLLLLRRW